MMMQHRITGMMALGMFTLFSAQAQEITLDPVTISTSIVEKRTSETGRNLTVIRGEDLKDLPASSLDEVLRYLPGLEIQARGPMGSQSDILLRGGTFQQVLVVVDGLRINDPTTGHFNSYIPIAPSEIARIEILKGASSSLYGSEAVGGVVSVITKSFDQRLAEENSLDGSLTLGSYGLWKANVGGYLRKGKLVVAGGWLGNSASGPELREMKGFFHNHTVSLSARYQLSDRWHLAYRHSYDSRDFAAQNFYTQFVSDMATEKVSGWLQQVEAVRKKEKNTLSLRAAFKRTSDDYRYNPQATPNENLSGLLQGQVIWQQVLAENLDWAAGLHYQRRSIESNDRGDHAIQQLAPFVTASYRIAGLTLHPSLRLDWREKIGTELIPQLNLSYKYADFQFRGSLGKTIRDADFTERFNNYNKEWVTGGSIGNPGLKAERSLSFELGADWFSGVNWKISTTYFQRNQKDLIDYIPTPWAEIPRRDNLAPEGSFALAMNIASVTTRGWEADVQYQKQIGERQRVTGMLGVKLLDSRQSLDVPSFYLSSHSKFLLNGSVTYRYNRLSLAVNGLYKEREPREADGMQTQVEKRYAVFNGRAGYDILPSRLGVFLQVDNLTDKRYSDLLGAVMPGRWWMGGLKFNW